MSSSGSRMNSHRRRPGPPGTIVVGRFGSHSCQAGGSNTRSSCRTRSMMSQSKKKPRSCIGAPISVRTKLFAPSAPMM